MKAVITAIGICTLLASPGAAYGACPGSADDYTLNLSGANWDGATTWSATSPGGHPGCFAGDTAALSYSGNPVVKVNDDYSFTSATATYAARVRFLDAGDYTLAMASGLSVDASSRAVTLTQEGQNDDDDGEWDMAWLTLTAGDTATWDAKYYLDDGKLDVHGEVELNSSSSVASQAILQVDTGTSFWPDSLDINGGDVVGEAALLDFNESVTVQNTSSPFTDMTGYVDIEIEAGDTFSPKELSVGDGALDTFVEMKTDTGTMAPTKLTVTAGDAASEHATMKVSTGSLNVSGSVILIGAASVDADAKLEVSNGATFAPYELDLRGDTDSTDGYAVLTINENVTVDSGNNHTDPDTLMQGFVDVTLGDSTTFDAHDVSLNANVDLQVTGTHLTRSIYTFDSQTYNNAANVTFAGPLRVEG